MIAAPDTIRVVIPLTIRKRNGRPKILPPDDVDARNGRAQDPHVLRAIARALITRPSLLILDEPTEGIQPSIIKEIGQVLSGLREQGEMAIILVEQYIEFALNLADDVIDRTENVLEFKEELARPQLKPSAGPIMGTT